MTILSVTPLLTVSDEPVLFATRCLDTVTAVDRMLAGEHVVVSTLTNAKAVLMELGLSAAAAEERLHFAVTGEVLTT